MNRALSAAVAAAVLCGFSTAGARGDDSVLAEMYGQGVHAYFAGDYFNAHSMLTGAIQQGSQDPRAYFFRGLCYAWLGRPDEAAADFKKGADLEANSMDRAYPVSDSLQRIQGRTRMQLEKYRQMARLAARTRTNRAEQARYDEQKPGVLRTPRRSAAAGPVSDPFAEDAEAAPQKAPPRPAPAIAAPATEDPFGAPAAATPAAPATADPFGTPAAPAATPAEADPFGAPAAPATPATPSDDPFGAPAATPAADPFMDDKPAPADAANPFGE
jgi:tetratricopeptide (TPR) repeat protein